MFCTQVSETYFYSAFIGFICLFQLFACVFGVKFFFAMTLKDLCPHDEEVVGGTESGGNHQR